MHHLVVLALGSGDITDLLRWNDWYRLWVRCWKTACLCFGLFSSPASGLNSKLLESSRSRFQHRGQFPCISQPPLPPPPPHLLQACVCLEGGLTHSFTAMQPHHLSSSQWHASPQLPHLHPFNPPPKHEPHLRDHTARTISSFPAHLWLILFVYLFTEVIMQMEELH